VPDDADNRRVCDDVLGVGDADIGGRLIVERGKLYLEAQLLERFAQLLNRQFRAIADADADIRLMTFALCARAGATAPETATITSASKTIIRAAFMV
jgi:hypothetical protein